MAHSHEHAHGQLDDVALTSEKGIRALKISMLGLGLTAAFQAGIAIVGGSAGLLADTLHNLADIFTAVPLWVAFVLARREANRRYTYGYGRAEDVAGAVIVLIILISAGIAGYESYVKLVSGTQPTLVGLGMLAGLIGFAGNELVALYRIRVGREIGSAALIADGQHARVDGLTSLAAFLGLLGVWLGFPIADPLAGLFITLFILAIVVQAGRSILARLMDAIEPDTIDEIEHRASSVEGVEGIHEVRARWLGHRVIVELHLRVPADLTVRQGHQIAEEVRHELLHHVPRVQEIIVHVDPEATDDQADHALTEHHFGGARASSRPSPHQHRESIV